MSAVLFCSDTVVSVVLFCWHADCCRIGMFCYVLTRHVTNAESALVILVILPAGLAPGRLHCGPRTVFAGCPTVTNMLWCRDIAVQVERTTAVMPH